MKPERDFYLYTTDDLNEEEIFEDYRVWLSNIKETLPYEKRLAILKRIRRKEIARERKLIRDFQHQFD